MSNTTIIKNDGQVLQVIIHGVPYAAIDRSGHLGILGIGAVFTSPRQLFWTKVMRSLSVKGADYLCVVSRQRVRLKTGFQNRINMKTKFSPLFEVTVAESGNSSLTMVTKLWDKDTGEECAKNMTLFVRLDFATRRPIPLPSDFYSEFPNKYRSPSHIWSREKFPERSVVFKKTMKMRHSDTDIQSHVNNVVYSKLCIDCATDAAVSGFYRHYNVDMCWFPILEYDLHFLGESKANDVLTCLTWQAENNDQRIFFLIEKDKKVITQASFLFGLEKLSGYQKSKV